MAILDTSSHAIDHIIECRRFGIIPARRLLHNRTKHSPFYPLQTPDCPATSPPHPRFSPLSPNSALYNDVLVPGRMHWHYHSTLCVALSQTPLREPAAATLPLHPCTHNFAP